jgi:hypothetical protein
MGDEETPCVQALNYLKPFIIKIQANSLKKKDGSMFKVRVRRKGKS